MVKILKHSLRLITGIAFIFLTFPEAISSYQEATNYHELRRFGRGTAMSIAWHPNEPLIAIGGSLGIWLYTSTLEDIAHLEANLENTRSVVWSPNGSKIATVNKTDVVFIWDYKGGEISLSLTLDEYAGRTFSIDTVKWSPDSTKVAAISQSGVVIWDAITGQRLYIFESSSTLAWNLDSQKILVNSLDQVQIIDVSTGQQLKSFLGPSGNWKAINWRLDNIVVVYNELGLIEAWDIETEHELLLTLDDIRFVLSTSISPTGLILVEADSDHKTKLWDMHTGQFRATLQDPTTGLRSLSWSPDGKRLIGIAGEDTGIQIWDSETGALVSTVYGFTQSQNDISWSPTTEKIAALEPANGIRIWDIETGKQSLFIATSEYSLDWSPIGDKIATATAGRTISLWNPDNGELIYSTRLSDKEGEMRSARWSPDGNRLASVDTLEQILIWDTSSRSNMRLVTGFRCHPNGPSEIFWSPDGRWIASFGWESLTIYICNATTGEPLVSFEGHTTLAWSPDSHTIASAKGNSAIAFWNALTGEQLAEVDSNSGSPISLAWNPDRELLASGYLDGTIKIMDVTTRVDLVVLEGHADFVTSVVWSVDGLLLASASLDGTLRLWSE